MNDEKLNSDTDELTPANTSHARKPLRLPQRKVPSPHAKRLSEALSHLVTRPDVLDRDELYPAAFEVGQMIRERLLGGRSTRIQTNGRGEIA